MTNRIAILLSTLAALTAVPFAGAADTEWHTLRGGNERHGFYPAWPDGKLKLAWRAELHKEFTGPRAEVIVAQGLAFIGTYRGNVYAYDAATGAPQWKFAAGPVYHSCTYEPGKPNESGTLYAASLDGDLHALDARTGSPRWKFAGDAGIAVAPTVSNGLVLFGDRDGVFHALRSTDGSRAFTFNTSGPILAPASVTADGKHVVFTGEDMHVYCLSLPAGKLKWKSRKLAGMSLRDYPPVIAHGLVFVGTNPVRDFHKDVLDADETFLLKQAGFAPADDKDRRYIAGGAKEVSEEQAAIVERLTNDPSRQTFYALSLDDGREPWVAPILYTSGLHNPPTPPCVNPATGDVFVILRSAYSTWDGGGEVRSFTAIGKLDPKTGRVALIDHTHPATHASGLRGKRDLPFASFNLIGDETQSLSCAGNRLFSNHQGTLGELDLASGRCKVAWGKRDTYGGFYGPGTYGWEKDGGEAKAAAAGQPYALINEWHGPARGIASVAGGRVYLNVGSQVICLEAEKK